MDIEHCVNVWTDSIVSICGKTVLCLCVGIECSLDSKYCVNVWTFSIVLMCGHLALCQCVGSEKLCLCVDSEHCVCSERCVSNTTITF